MNPKRFARLLSGEALMADGLPSSEPTRKDDELVGGTTEHSTATCAPGMALPPPGTFPSIPGYRIEAEIARGGMGVVYRAWQESLQRTVAIKIVLDGELAGDEARRRFLIEARAAARLSHPNIVQVFEIGEAGGRLFFAMEYCSGGSLLERSRLAQPEPIQAARSVMTLARAVQAAHDARVLHRDLKPANVLLTADGTLKLADFGLARQMDEAGRTASGMPMGTPGYMAPEQVRAQVHAQGEAVDVYGLGGILYHQLTGRPPFQADAMYDALERVLHEPPVPVRQRAPEVPLALEAICLRCLEKEPAKRFRSARDLADALEEFCKSPDKAPRRPWPWHWAALAGVVLLLGLIVCIAVSRSGGGPDEGPFPVKTLHALVVGVGSDDNRIPSDDAEAVRELLLAQEGSLAKRVQLDPLFDKEATRAAILGWLKARAGKVIDDDLVVIYLSGAGGSSDQAGRAFVFGCHNADPTIPEDEAGLGGGEFLAALAACGGRAVVLVDAAKAGALEKDLPKQFNPVLILACGATEEAYVSQASRHGLFTQALLDALQPDKSPANTNSDGQIDTRELAQFVQKHVVSLARPMRTDDGQPIKQTPVICLPRGEPWPLASLKRLAPPPDELELTPDAP
jgi:serine/threonine protein kinase